jgi:cytochrome c oxidase subunit 3
MADVLAVTATEEQVAREHLAHHFDTPQQQFDAGKLGMWMFLATEMLLFSGLFCAYAVFRATHPEVFKYAGQYLDPVSGLINALILLTSGLTMALAVRFAQTGKRAALSICLALTMLGGVAFLAIHAKEYFDNGQAKLLWGTHYAPTVGPNGKPVAPVTGLVPLVVKPKPAAKSGWARLDELKKAGFVVSHSQIMPAPHGPAGVAVAQKQAPASNAFQPANVQIFFGIYFLMTGLHSLHVIIGIIVIGWLLIRSLRGEFGPGYYAPVDYVGMYWGVVDMVWMFLFPLLYLIH